MVALTVLGAGCGSSTADPTPAPSAPSTPDASAVTTAATATVVPATTTTTTTTTTTPSASVTGRRVAFTMSDGELTFTITTDESTATAEVVLAPSDGSTSPRWVSVVPWTDEVNASGHRPFDGLPAEPVTDGSQAAAHRQLVADYVQTALVEGRWEDVDRFFRDGQYVLHGPLFADGLESVRSFFIGLRDAGAPFLITGTSVWLAAGNFVLAISRHDAADGATAYWDLWRVDDGAIAEHWDAVAPIPAAQADAWFAGAGVGS